MSHPPSSSRRCSVTAWSRCARTATATRRRSWSSARTPSRCGGPPRPSPTDRSRPARSSARPHGVGPGRQPGVGGGGGRPADRPAALRRLARLPPRTGRRGRARLRAAPGRAGTRADGPGGAPGDHPMRSTADGIEVMHWRAYVGNWASRRTAWRCGFRVEGTVRRLLSANGRRYDAWVGLPDQGRADGAGPPLARRAGARGPAGAPAALARGRRAGDRPAPDRARPPVSCAAPLPTPEGFGGWLTAPALPRPPRARPWAGASPTWTPTGRSGTCRSSGCASPDAMVTPARLLAAHRGPRARRAMTRPWSCCCAHAFAGRADGGLGLRRLHAGTARATPPRRRCSSGRGSPGSAPSTR